MYCLDVQVTYYKLIKQLLGKLHILSGIVVKNLVAPEELINEGQALLIFKTLNLELMIPSPITGKVTELNYETGSEVEKGSCLVTISPIV